MRLTPKGEQLLLNIIGYGIAAAISLSVLAALGVAGFIETLN